MNESGSRALFLLVLLSSTLCGQNLPAGTTFEARFSVATGSRISHRGDPVEATTIAPVSLRGTMVIPEGTRIRGNVGNVVQLGFGLKHRTASIEYQFSSLELPCGATIPMEARLVNVETARETADRYGVVIGVHPLANLSSASNYYTLPLLFLNPVVGVPVWGMKALIAPSTSPEIYFPPGAEFLMRLESPLDVSHLPRASAPIRPLSANDMADTRELLQDPSQFRAFAGNRPSDLVNLLFIGTRRQIDNAFQAAGWSAAERKSPVALYKMYRALTRRIGYRNAPMNKLSLNGKYSDFVYQKSLNTIAKRHHVRFWRQSPEGDVWLGAATEDVGLRFRPILWTHVVDPAIDHERAKVVNDLAFTGCIASADLATRDLKPESKIDTSIKTDGEVAAIRFSQCGRPKEMPDVPAHQTSRTGHWFPSVMKSFRDDLVRSNPAFTAFNTFRSLTNKRQTTTPIQTVKTEVIRPGLDWLKWQEGSTSTKIESSAIQ